MRIFKTGATRNDDTTKLDPEGFLNPEVLRIFCEYMNKHRYLEDGNIRASDNWQLGIPTTSAMKSLLRHVCDLWLLHRGYRPGFSDPEATIEDALCAIIFNASAYLLALTKQHKEDRNEDTGNR